MNRTLHIEQSRDSKQVHLPFSNLVAMLQAEGFSIKPDDYVEILKVVETFGDENLNELKYRLAPLICTTEEEQKKFYRIFEEYVRISIPVSGTTEAGTGSKRQRKLPKSLYITVALLIIAMIAWIFYPAKMISAKFDVYINGQFSSGAHKAIIGDTLLLDASPAFRDDKGNTFSDSAEMQLSWDTGQGWVDNGPVIFSMLLQEEGPRRISLRLSRSGKMNESSALIEVCRVLVTGLNTESNPEELSPKDEIVVYPEVRGNNSLLKNIRWFVNGKEIENRSQTLAYRFDSAAGYAFRFIAGDTAGCLQEAERTFVVEDDIHPVSLTVKPGGERLQPQTQLNSWLWGLLILPLSALFWVYRKHKAASTARDKSQLSAASIAVEPPFEVPMDNQEMQLINREPEMNLLFRSMRNKTEDEGKQLNIKKSITAEIRSGGIPSIVYSGKSRHEEYCILIDRSFSKGQQLFLFEYLVRLFQEENISVERFFYSGFDLFYNENFPAGISLQRLSELYKSHILLIFGNAHQLIYPAWPVVEKEKAEWLHEWEFKAIITPLSYKDWTEKEDAIKKQFILLPADIPAQIRLIQAIKERQLNHDKFLRAEKSFYEAEDFYFNDTNEIRKYLDDDILYQWLCATCIYPKVRWEILIAIGKTICSINGIPQKLNYSSLLKLSRISWLKEGIFPEQTRLDLLKDLSVANEIAARETLIDMLKYADLYFRGDYFFEEEKDMQQVTNEFILYANDQNSYRKFEPSYQRFRELWKNDKISDGPLRAYLDKNANSHWQTPVQLNGNNLSVDQFLQLEEKYASKLIWKKFLWQYAVSLLMLGGLIFLFTAGKPLLESYSTDVLPFVNTDSSGTFDMRFILQTDSCFQTGNINPGLTGSLSISGNNYPLNFESGDRGRITLPYTAFNASQGMVNLRWNNNRSSASSVIPVSTSAELILNTCTSITRPPLYIRYNNESKYQSDSVQQLIQLLGNYYEIKEVLQDSFTQSKLIYYTETDQSKADSILGFADVFGMKVEKEFIKENRTLPAVPILYLALTSPSSKNDWKNISKNAIPPGIVEIWKGNRNNRFFKYDGNRIWYSTGNKFTYGIYPVTRVQVKEEVYKIISGIYEEYQVMFLKNVSSNRFDLAFCQSRFKSLEEALQTGENDCGTFNSMVLNYPADNKLVFVPANGINFLSRERSKLDKYSAGTNIAVQQRSLNDSVIVYVNSANNRDEETRLGIIRKSLNYTLPSYSWGSGTFRGSPFDRDYLMVKPDNPPVEPGTDKSKEPEVESDLGNLIIDSKGYPDENSLKLISRIAGQLKDYPGWKIRLEADYTGDAVQKQITRYISNVKNIFYKEGVNTTQVTEKLTAIKANLYNTQPPVNAKTNRANVVPGTVIRVVGINFSPARK